MTAVFDSHGLKFQYPENWKLHEGPKDRMPFDISIESPKGAIWTINVFPPESDCEALAIEALDSFKEQYDSVEFREVTEQHGDFELDGYDVNFYCLDLLIETHIRRFRISDSSFVMLMQAEDRDFEECNLVFSAITTSFLSNLGLV